MSLDLRKLRHATLLAEELSFARAADRLHISQSALSQSIVRLEEDIGIKLFDRDRRTVVLTAAGKTFVARAEALLLQVRGFDHDVTLMRDCVIGHVHFGIGPLPAAGLLPQLLRGIALERPQLNVQVDIKGGRDLFELLVAEKIEFFVADRRHVAKSGSVTTQHLVDWRLACYVRPSHPLLARTSARKKADLANYPMLSIRAPEEVNPAHWEILDQFQTDGLSQTIHCDDIAILKEIAASTDAILITTAASIAQDMATGKLRELKVSDMRKVSVNLIIVSLLSRSLSPAAMLVIDKFQRLAGNQIAAHPL